LTRQRIKQPRYDGAEQFAGEALAVVERGRHLENLEERLDGAHDVDRIDPGAVEAQPAHDIITKTILGAKAIVPILSAEAIHAPSALEKVISGTAPKPVASWPAVESIVSARAAIAVKVVGSAPTDEDVAAALAVEGIRVPITAEVIVSAGTDQAFNTGECVGAVAGGDACPQIGGDADRRASSKPDGIPA